MAESWLNGEMNGNGYRENKIERNVSPGLALSSMKISRYFTQEGKNPFEFDIFGNPINWISEKVDYDIFHISAQSALRVR